MNRTTYTIRKTGKWEFFTGNYEDEDVIWLPNLEYAKHYKSLADVEDEVEKIREEYPWVLVGVDSLEIEMRIML